VVQVDLVVQVALRVQEGQVGQMDPLRYSLGSPGCPEFQVDLVDQAGLEVQEHQGALSCLNRERIKTFFFKRGTNLPFYHF